MARAVDISPILTYIYRMKEKELVIKSKNISTKQWSALLLELNLIVQAWRPYATLELKAPGLKKVLGWGTRRYDHKE
jgi:hypothetical protein